MTPTIGIVDLGGQYCHLIARRVRDMGVAATVLPDTLEGEDCAGYQGLVLSGGPNSVYDPDSPTIKDGVLHSGKPILGICYGHQLLVHKLGGTVERSHGEYGPSDLVLADVDALFDGLPPRQRVWMSHADAVTRLPEGAIRLAGTDTCRNAAFALPKSGHFGVQFHPEVVHSECGEAILRNFVERVCGITHRLPEAPRVPGLVEDIRRQAGDRSVFFLVSGGVDSTVAFALCARALPKERVLGLYVDTGLMRKGETQELRDNLRSIGLDERLFVRDESKRFLGALAGVTEPEEKRRIIGRLFVDVQSDAMKEYGVEEAHWMLGQGTIYPDTIESGGSSGQAAVIKTHHNRVEEIRRLMEQGRVIEPLAEFYKDQVRAIGLELGLSTRLTDRWPFPGPGLAIRCLCSDEAKQVTEPPRDLAARGFAGFTAHPLPVRSVGVQGDGRTYRALAAITGPLAYDKLQRVSSMLCNEGVEFNRVAYFVKGADRLETAKVAASGMEPARIERLREADHVVRRMLEREGLTDAVWQFPVVLLPLQVGGGESVVLRPVNSTDGMTANFARLPERLIREMADEILKLEGVGAVFLDVTDKPPATIEWE